MAWNSIEKDLVNLASSMTITGQGLFKTRFPELKHRNISISKYVRFYKKNCRIDLAP